MTIFERILMAIWAMCIIIVLMAVVNNMKEIHKLKEEKKEIEKIKEKLKK